ALSLGYFQPLDGGIDLAAIRARGYDIVRRPTGGRAILHVHELTYSVSVPQDAIRGGNSVMASYREISRGVAAGLALLGAQVSLGEQAGAHASAPAPGVARPICFARTARCDLQAQGRKVVGSAQVRRDGCILQHGSIPLVIDLDEQCAVMPGSDRRLASRALASAATSVSALLGRPVGYEELSAAVARGFAEALGVTLLAADLSAPERAEAQRLRATKYATTRWTERGPGRR
ncbi:MAG: biotin/lipoate A/B protein ligase family protein, partial [Armatimonadota bacterium]